MPDAQWLLDFLGKYWTHLTAMGALVTTLVGLIHLYDRFFQNPNLYVESVTPSKGFLTFRIRNKGRAEAIDVGILVSVQDLRHGSVETDHLPLNWSEPNEARGKDYFSFRPRGWAGFDLYLGKPEDEPINGVLTIELYGTNTVFRYVYFKDPSLFQKLISNALDRQIWLTSWIPFSVLRLLWFLRRRIGQLNTTQGKPNRLELT